MEAHDHAQDDMANFIQAIYIQVKELGDRLDARLNTLESRLIRVEEQWSAAGNLRVRDKVRIIGLDSAAHQGLNGKKAQLRNWEGPGGRWVVQVTQTNELKSLKAENLFPEAGTANQSWGGGFSVGDVVEIQHLRRQNQLNGSRAEIKGWDDEGGRWIVELADKRQRRRLRTGNLKRIGEAVSIGNLRPRQEVAEEDSTRGLEPGATVRLQGLRTQSLNGKLAVVSRWDGKASRFVVQMIGTKEEKSLREENLIEVVFSQRAGQVARIERLEQSAHLNGKSAELLHWDTEKSRWNVRLAGSDETKLLRPENLTLLVESKLLPGRLAQVFASGDGPESLHNRRCELLRWDANAGQWFVRLDSADDGRTEYWLRPANLRLIPAEEVIGGDAEILGDSSDSDIDVPGAELRRGALVAVDGAQDKRARLVRWLDEGGPFGLWEAHMDGTEEVVKLNPSQITAITRQPT